MEQGKQHATHGDKWSSRRPSKTALFWSCVASAVLTMIIGFTWGGWVRGATAQSMASTMADEAVVKRLAPICVFESKSDPARAQKLKQLKEMSAFERGDFVKKQGWATMPGEKEPDSSVADACAEVIAP